MPDKFDTTSTQQSESHLTIIHEYARSWSMLQGYDDQTMQHCGVKHSDMLPLSLDEALSAIGDLKEFLMSRGDATDLFGQLRGDGLESALAAIEQGYGDDFFYPNVASRAAHLLYFVIKNHPLSDGNKRSGSFLFLWYLSRNQHLTGKPVQQMFSNNAMVALALMIAESNPNQKDIMIRLIENFIIYG